MTKSICASLSLLLLLVSLPVRADEREDLARSIETLNETQKAILKELQEIRRLLQQQQLQPRAAAEVLPSAPIDISGNPQKGASAAKVALLEFSEFQCPYCARFARDTWPQLQKEYVDTGRVKHVWLDLPLDNHKNAQKAAEAAHCAGEHGRFWEMHDRMFADQKQLDVPSLAGHAEALGLDRGAFLQCVESGRFAEEIRRDGVHARSASITGTPSFLIGVVQPNGSVKVMRKLVGAKSFAEFKEAIDPILAAVPAQAK